VNVSQVGGGRFHSTKLNYRMSLAEPVKYVLQPALTVQFIETRADWNTHCSADWNNCSL